MTDKDKATLLHFITRPGMYVHPIDRHTITAFVHGFIVGSDNNGEFVSLLKEHGHQHLGIRYDADRWPGQISRYAKKNEISWELVFRQLTLHILTSEEVGGITDGMRKYLNLYIIRNFDVIRENGAPWFDASWIEEWKLVCLTNSAWFGSMWTSEELKILKSINYSINRSQIFEDSSSFKPTRKVLKMKSKFDELLLQSGYQRDIEQKQLWELSN